MQNPSRRNFLKASILASAVGLSAPLSFQNMVFSKEAEGPILIIIHLRGGCDGLNFVSPANDQDFIAARSSDLRVLCEGKDAGYSLAHGPSANIDFRLHNAAGGLSELYNDGQLAFIHASGLTNSTRSHFVATDMIEAGVASEQDLSTCSKGWLARALERSDGFTGLRGLSLSGELSGDLHGYPSALAIPDINNGVPYIGGLPISSILLRLYENSNNAIRDAGMRALQLPIIIDRNIQRDAQSHPLPYLPEYGASYDQAGSLAASLKSAAHLIKMEIGLRALTIDFGGFDTHEYQAGRFRGLIDPLSKGLAAFWNDLASYHDRLIVLGLSEFGRRLRSNKSNGTDHGRAGLMFVLGGKVMGGRFYGTWPGLNSSQLDEGVDLAVTTDYRQVLTEVLNHWSSSQKIELFPNFNSVKPLGLFV